MRAMGLRRRTWGAEPAASPATPPASEDKYRRVARVSSRFDAAVLATVTVLALFTRFYRIAEPAAVVFDELHFSKFVDRVLTSTWFFDIHPPLGKLILAYGGRLLGYKPDPTFVIEKIGQEYPPHINYVILRSISASFSVATVPMTYLISRSLRISPISSVLSTVAVLTDFLGIIEGRLILMDSQLLFFCQLALLCALKLWRTPAHTPQRVLWLCITGLAAGTALSIKHTALATPGLIAVVSFFGLHFLPEPLQLIECAYAAVCGLAVYTLSFFVMFNALWHEGGKYDKFMPMHFRKTLIGSEHYDPEAKRASFIRLFGYLNWRMVASNANIKKRHTWESVWYHWIVNWRGVLYYLKKLGDKETGITKIRIYLFANPVVAWLVLACVTLFLTGLLLATRYREHVRQRPEQRKLRWAMGTGVFLLSGWLCNLIPYVLVDRAAFVYHYMPGLFYGQLLTAAVFDFLPPKPRVAAVAVSILLMVSALVYWSPWIYCFALTDAQHVKRRWLPRWT